MKKLIKLDPLKPFIVPKGFRVGKVIVNGEYRERPLNVFETTNIDDDNKFIRKLQETMYHRRLNDYNR
jgi:hypothetical protein